MVQRLALEPSGACGETFGNLGQWTDDMFDVPFIAGRAERWACSVFPTIYGSAILMTPHNSSRNRSGRSRQSSAILPSPQHWGIASGLLLDVDVDVDVGEETLGAGE